MPGTVAGLRIYQWGRESTAGTAVAATSKVLCEEFDFEEEDALYRPEYVNGVLLQNTGNEFAITRGTRWRASGPLSYQQAQHWLEMAIQDAVDPTGTDPYTWTYTRNATSIPAPGSFTLERRLNTGAAQVDQEWAYAMCSSLRLTGAPRGVVRFEAEGFARRVQSSTLTGALSLPTASLIPHGTSALYIDTAWASVGTTQITGQLLDWSLTLRPGGSVPLFTADGRSDLDFPVVVFDRSEAGLEFEATLLLDTTRYATEKAAAEAATLRAMQIKLDGAGDHDLEIDFLAKHERGSLFQVGSQQGQDIVRLRMVGSTDGTNFLRAILINNVSAFA